MSAQRSFAQELWERRLSESGDEAAVGCAGFGVRYNRWLYRLRRQVFNRTVRSLDLDLRDLKVLDVGAGTGFYIECWKKLGARHIEGLDFTEASVDRLRNQFPDLNFHRADIADHNLPLKPRSFDVISAFDVLFHIVDDEQYRAALCNMAAALRPGGLLLFSENFVHEEKERVSNYHFSRSLAVIQKCLSGAGLELESRRPMFVLMNAPDDSSSRSLAMWWRWVTRIASRSEKLGWLVGLLLYPIEWGLTRWMREGPSTELAVCRSHNKLQGRHRA